MMCAPLELVVPVTVITRVCALEASPDAVNTGSEARPGLPTAAAPAVSTVVAGPPSIDTVAIPQILHFRPIQVTAVPVKRNVAVAPVMSELPAVRPLNEATSAPRITQAAVGAGLTAGSPSSKRTGVAGGGPFETVTVTVADVVRLPAPSRATALSV